MTDLKEGWQVQWCTHIPEIGEELDVDNAVYVYREFKTEAQAMAFAKTKIDADWFGQVGVRRFWTDEYGLIEHGDETIVEDE